MTRSEKFRDRCEKIEGVKLVIKSRKREFVAMKRAYSLLCVKHYGDTDTLQMIGELLGRNHSTVSHYVNKSHFVNDKTKTGYRIEKHWYKEFKALIHCDSPAGRIQINMLIGFI